MTDSEKALELVKHGATLLFLDVPQHSYRNRYSGLKVVWPELKGVSGPVAKGKIESDNPHVTCVIIPENVAVVAINCCNRVVLRVPIENCPNGPVLNSPKVG